MVDLNRKDAAEYTVDQLMPLLGVRANVRAADGTGVTTVLTVNDTSKQIFNLSVAKSVNLPTSGVKTGDVWSIETRHSAGSLLSVNASAGGFIGYVDGLNGACQLVALQDTPTLPAHWRVPNPITCVTAARTLPISSYLGGMGMNVNRAVGSAYMNMTGDWRLKYSLAFTGNGVGSGSNGGYVYLDGSGVTSATNVVPHQTYIQVHSGYSGGGALTGISNIGQSQMNIYTVTGSLWTNTAYFSFEGDILLQFRPVWG